MVGTSRCIAATLSKFGGPKTLPQATSSFCVHTIDFQPIAREHLLSCTSRLSAKRKLHSSKKIIIATFETGFLALRVVSEGRWAHVQGREATASFAADA